MKFIRIRTKETPTSVEVGGKGGEFSGPRHEK